MGYGATCWLAECGLKAVQEFYIIVSIEAVVSQMLICCRRAKADNDGALGRS